MLPAPSAAQTAARNQTCKGSLLMLCECAHTCQIHDHLGLMLRSHHVRFSWFWRRCGPLQRTANEAQGLPIAAHPGLPGLDLREWEAWLLKIICLWTSSCSSEKGKKGALASSLSRGTQSHSDPAPVPPTCRPSPSAVSSYHNVGTQRKGLF